MESNARHLDLTRGVAKVNSNEAAGALGVVPGFHPRLEDDLSPHVHKRIRDEVADRGDF